MNENAEKAKAMVEQGKAVSMDKLNRLSEKADAIPFFKGNMKRKLIALGGVVIVGFFCFSWLFGGGFVTPTYDEVRIYSRALPHAEIITSANEGVDKVPETGKGK